MNAQERKSRIRHGVNQVANQVPAIRPQKIIFAAERHNAELRTTSGERRHAIRLQTRAADQEVTVELAVFRIFETPAGFVPSHLIDTGSGDHAATPPGDDLLERRDNAAIINDAFFGYMDRRQSGSMRLPLTQFRRGEALQPLEPVRLAPLKEIVEARDLFRCGRDDHLSADLVR